MVIRNADMARQEGYANLANVKCAYCQDKFIAFPLIRGHDHKHSLYHVRCAWMMAFDLLEDLKAEAHLDLAKAESY